MTTKLLKLITKDQYEAIVRSRARDHVRLARRIGVPEQAVTAVRAGCSLREAVEICAPSGTRVRIDTWIDSDNLGPAVGEWGTVQSSDDGGKLWVRWDGGSPLAVLPAHDRLSCAD